MALCEKCSGTGWEHRGESVTPCSCRREQKIREFLVGAEVPSRFAEASFETFRTPSAELKSALKQVRGFTEGDSHLGLLLLGNPGSGKTHLAIAALKTMIALRCEAGAFYDLADLLRGIQCSYGDKDVSESKLLRPVFEMPMLVLDELGLTKPTGWALETLHVIMNRRYNRCLTTIFTSNYLDADNAVMPETLTERVGPRLRSRLNEMCRTVTVNAPDYREVIAAQRLANLKVVKKRDS